MEFFRRISRGDLQGYLHSVTFRREYLGEFIADSERSVIPEWSKEVEENVLQPYRPPEFQDRYVGIDVGWRDGTGILFGFYDYRTGQVIIEDELLLFKSTPDTIAKEMIWKETELWPGKQPFIRVADNNLLFIIDLNTRYNLSIIPTDKDNKELAIASVRDLIRENKLVINPRCKRLLVQMSSTIWNKSRTSYERNSEGHGDLLDALVYLVRSIRRDKNPYPAMYGHPLAGLKPSEVLFIEPWKEKNESGDKLYSFFNTSIGAPGEDN